MKDDPLNATKVKRGMDLPHAKLTDDDVRYVRYMITHRDELLRQASVLTNGRIAEKMGVHVRTIDRISVGETWTHLV